MERPYRARPPRAGARPRQLGRRRALAPTRPEMLSGASAAYRRIRSHENGARTVSERADISTWGIAPRCRSGRTERARITFATGDGDACGTRICIAVDGPSVTRRTTAAARASRTDATVVSALLSVAGGSQVTPSTWAISGRHAQEMRRVLVGDDFA